MIEACWRPHGKNTLKHVFLLYLAAYILCSFFIVTKDIKRPNILVTYSPMAMQCVDYMLSSILPPEEHESRDKLYARFFYDREYLKNKMLSVIISSVSRGRVTYLRQEMLKHTNRSNEWYRSLGTDNLIAKKSLDTNFKSETVLLQRVRGRQGRRILGPAYEKPLAIITWLKEVQVDSIELLEDFDYDWLSTYIGATPCVEIAEVSRENIPQVIPVAPTTGYRFVKRPESVKVNFVEPNDPLHFKQNYLNQMSVLDAWRLNLKPQVSPIIAALDLGCDVSHEDLLNTYWKNEGEICDNGIDDDGNGYIDDCYGYNFYGRNAHLMEHINHGTASQGAIAAGTNNSIGITGICPQCRIMCLKTGDLNSYTSYFAEAINYLIKSNVKIAVYNSLGYKSKVRTRAIELFLKSGGIYINSAGNYKCDLDEYYSECKTISHPSSDPYENMLIVGAVNADDTITNYSNYGVSFVDIFAPGEIYTTFANSTYGVAHGTSFSAPLVAAVVGYILSIYPSLPPKILYEAIIESSRIPTHLRNKGRGGIIDLYRALLYTFARQNPIRPF